MDWGYNDPCAVLWFAVDGQGRVFLYRELYESRVLSSDMAKRVRELSAGERIAYTVASPDAWQERGMTGSADIRGESIAEVFGNAGVPLLRADSARVAGWQRVREYLKPADDGRPRLQIFSSCKNLLRTLPLLVFDERDSEDVSDACEDHAPEALRYGLMSRPVGKEPQKEAPLPRYDPFADADEVVRGGFALL